MPRTNAERAEHAYRAVLTYESDSSVEECISDLLGDLRHLCDESGYDYAERDGVGYRNYLTELGEERKGGTVEELAVEILKARDLPAELWQSGGGVMLARVDGEHGVYALVSQTEGDGEPFSVGGYAEWADEPELVRCAAEQLPDVVRNQLTMLEAAAV